MRQIIHGDSYKGYPLSTTYQNDQGFHKVILDKIIALLTNMTQRHSKAFFTMLELHYPANSSGVYPDNNALFSTFIESLTKHFERDPRGYDPSGFWVRERSMKTGQFHYHIMITVDGNKCQNARGILTKATELWGRRLVRDAKGLVHLAQSHVCDNGYGGVQLIRNSPEFQQVFDHCFQCGSYFAKAYSKGTSAAYVNEYGCSRLP